MLLCCAVVCCLCVVADARSSPPASRTRSAVSTRIPLSAAALHSYAEALLGIKRSRSRSRSRSGSDTSSGSSSSSSSASCSDEENEAEQPFTRVGHARKPSAAAARAAAVARITSATPSRAAAAAGASRSSSTWKATADRDMTHADKELDDPIEQYSDSSIEVLATTLAPAQPKRTRTHKHTNGAHKRHKNTQAHPT